MPDLVTTRRQSDFITRDPGQILDALGELGFGGIILDPLGRVLDTNDRAARYLGFDLELRQFSSKAQSNDLALGALRKALGKASAASPLINYVIAVPRGQNRPLLLRTVRFKSRATEGNPTIALVVLDPDDLPKPSTEVLSLMFRLTPAEARLAQFLCEGTDLATIAEQLGIKAGTLRVQLKSVFAKTGTSRQAELVAILTHLAHACRSDPH